MTPSDIADGTQDEAGKAVGQGFHCWESGPLTGDGCSTTCMLKDGHEGSHQWTRDDQIVINFSPSHLPGA
jgi:hypothetical protein